MPTLELSRPVYELRCVVNGCVREKDAARCRFFKVPKRASLLEDWCYNLRIDVASISGQEVHVCERHFEAHCFSAYKLRPGARPTLHLGHDDELDLLPNPAKWEEDVNVCFVPSCGRSKDVDNVELFGLPRIRGVLEKWLQNFRLEPSREQLQGMRICSAHFEPSCMENGRLHLGSVPTLQLGHDELDNIHQSAELPSSQLKGTRIAMGYDCCYPQCMELQKSYQRIAYELPQQEALRNLWLSYLGLEQHNQEPLKLCPLHLIILYEHSVNHFPEHSSEEQLLDANYEAARNSVRIRIISCAVRGCRTLKPRDDYRLHAMPTRRDVLQMWLDNMQLVFYEQQRYMYKVCSRHFEAICVTETTRRLKPWSMPTLELPERDPEAPPLHQNPSEEEWQRMNEQIGSCEAVQSLEPAVKLEPEPIVKQELHSIVKLEPKPQSEQLYEEEEEANDQQQALEVLLEVGHVEKCTTYEQMDTKPIISYAETLSHNSLGPTTTVGSACIVGNGFTYSARHCSVRGCDVTSLDVNDSLKLHKFPTSLDAMEKWMHNTQVNVDINFAWRFRICSLHFLPECFNGSRIRRGAMPTLRLGSRRLGDIYDNEFNVQPEQASVNQSAEASADAAVPTEPHDRATEFNINLHLPCPAPPRKSSKFCQIDGCSNHLTSENLTLHKFPHSADMCAKWQHNTQVPFDPEYRWRYRICSAHFEPICLGNMRLMHGSVPTLKLGARAPKQLFGNDFAAISLRLDKEKRSADQSLSVKQEQVEDDQEQYDQEQEDLSMLVPELQLHEGDDEQEDNQFNYTNSWSDSQQQLQLRLPSIKQEKGTIYNPVKSGYDKCSLVHCQRQRSQHGVHIYKFPRSRQLQHRWMHNLRIRYDERRPWKTMICSVHFEPHCIRLRKLRPWAVPTLELGDNVPRDLYRNEQSQLQFEQQRSSDVEAGSEGEDYDAELDDTILEEYDDEYDDNDNTGQIPAEPHIKREYRSRCEPQPAGKLPPWKIKQCCLPYCRRPRGDGIKLFRLPNNISAIRKWEQATGMRFYESQRNTKLICSRHFDPQLIGVRRLMSNAVPTRNLGPNNEESEPPASSPRCCIKDCQPDGHVKLHKFPSGKY